MTNGPAKPNSVSAERVKDFKAATEAGLKAASAMQGDAQARAAALIKDHAHNEQELGSVLQLAGLLGVRGTVNVPGRYGEVLAALEQQLAFASPTGGTAETK